MVYVISEKEKAAAFREKKKLLLIWFGVLALYIIIAGALVGSDFYFVEVHRNRSHTFWMGAVCALSTAGFFSFTLFFFAVKYRLTRKYVRMLRDMDRGLKDEIVAKFIGYDNSISMKDGVFFYSMILKTKPLRRDDIDERKLLIEQTVPKIELNEGAKLKLISHANILVAYEILDPGQPQEDCARVESQAEKKTENEKTE